MHGSTLYPTTHSQHKHSRVRQRTFGVWLFVSFFGCAKQMPVAQPVAPQQAPVLPPATPRGQSQRLLAFGVHLPDYPEHPCYDAVAFVRAATSCVEHIYLDDTDDPSVVDALLEQLQQSRSSVLQSDWHAVLTQARTRCLELRALGPVLRPLRQSLQHAWRDELHRTYQSVDEALCGITQQQWQKLQQNQPQLKRAQTTIVTIEPLGSYPLQVFLRLCQTPKSLFGKESPSHTP